jgi:hypothetical protein
MNLQGATADYSSVGLFETKKVTNVTSNTITVDTAFTNAYSGNTQKIIVQRVPNYTNVTINSGNVLTVDAWNGGVPTGTSNKGGVLFFRAMGTVSGAGTIDLTNKGYRAAEGINGYPGRGGGGGGGGGWWQGGVQGAGNGGGGGYGSAGVGKTVYENGGGGVTYGAADLSQNIYFGSGGGGGGGSYVGGGGSGYGGGGGTNWSGDAAYNYDGYGGSGGSGGTGSSGSRGCTSSSGGSNGGGGGCWAYFGGNTAGTSTTGGIGGGTGTIGAGGTINLTGGRGGACAAGQSAGGVVAHMEVVVEVHVITEVQGHMVVQQVEEMVFHLQEVAVEVVMVVEAL